MVMSAGAVTVGAMLSSTVITCTCWVLLPQSSVSDHVLVMICSPSQAPSATASLKVASSEVSQLSASSVTSPVTPTDASYAQLASLYIVMSAGWVNVGAMLSSTVITCTCWVLLPQSSVSDQVLVIICSPSQVPFTTASLNVASSDVSQLSASSVTSPVIPTDASYAQLASLYIVMSAGWVNVGAMLSSTVITCTCWVLLPQSSVSVQVLVIICSPSQVPFTTASLNVASSDVSQLSASSVTSPVTPTDASYVQLAFLYMVMSAGAVNVGAMLSSTVITCTCWGLLPQSSVSVQVLVIICSPSQVPFTTASLKVASSDVSQLSASSVTSPVIPTDAS